MKYQREAPNCDSNEPKNKTEYDSLDFLLVTVCVFLMHTLLLIFKNLEAKKDFFSMKLGRLYVLLKTVIFKI
jgi:hypothetical protein